MSKKLKNFLIFFFIFSILWAATVYFLQPSLHAYETANQVFRKIANPNQALNYSQNIYSYYVKAFYFVISTLDKYIPKFPTPLLTWLQTVSGIYYLLSLPYLLLIAFLLTFKKLRHLSLILALGLLIITLPTKSWAQTFTDNSIRTLNLRYQTPWSEKIIQIWSPDNNSPFTTFSYTWTNNSKTQAPSYINVSCLGHYQLTVNNQFVGAGPFFGPLPNIYYDTYKIDQFIVQGPNLIEITCNFISDSIHEHPQYQKPLLFIGGQIKQGIFTFNLANYRFWSSSSRSDINNATRLSSNAGYALSVSLPKAVEEMTVFVYKTDYKLLPRPVPSLHYLHTSNQFSSINHNTTVDLGRISTGYLKINPSSQCHLRISWLSIFPHLDQEQSDELDINTVWIYPVRRSGKYINFELIDCEHGLTYDFIQSLSSLNIPTFTTSSDLDAQIYELARNSLINNIQSVFEDSLVRERAMYVGDSREISQCLALDPNNLSYIKQMLKQFALAQTAQGWIPAMSASGDQMLIPDYSLSWLIWLTDYYRLSHDKNFIVEMQPHINKLLYWIKTNTREDLFVHSSTDIGWWIFIDWTQIDRSKLHITSLQLFYLKALDSAIFLSDQTGITLQFDLKSQFQRSFAKINTLSFDSSQKLFSDSFDNNSQSQGHGLVTNALGASLGFFPTQYNQQALKHFRVQPFTQSPYSQAWVVAWYLDSDPQFALKILRQYWGGMLKHQATSVFEWYDPLTNTYQGSPSHAWGCAPIYLYPQLYKSIAQ